MLFSILVMGREVRTEDPSVFGFSLGFFFLESLLGEVGVREMSLLLRLGLLQ